MDASRIADGLKRTARALPWPRLGVVAAVVVVGVSQIFFSLLTHNADYFPKEPWFHLGVLAWVVLLPFALLLALDLGVSRWGGRWGFPVWRAALYTFLFASLLRQTQVYYPAPFQWFFERIPPRPPMYGLLGLAFLLCLRSKTLVHRYAAVCGLLAVMLTFSYIYRMGLLGEAWRDSPVAASASVIGWKKDPVLLCVFDELSNDVLLKDGKIDAELFPNFAALAADSAWFTNAKTHYMFTKDAFPCMLTGRLNPPSGTPKLFDYLPPECRVVVREYFPATYAWMRKHARAEQTFLLQGEKEEPLRDLTAIPAALIDLFRETPFSRSPFGVRPAHRILPVLFRRNPKEADSTASEISRFLSTVNPRDLEGTLVFWHSEVPHFPYRYNPDGTFHGDTSNSQFLGGGSGPERPPGYHHALTMANYHKQIRYADLVLGRLVETLKREGLYERTTLVVTSDHGLRTWGALPTDHWPDVLAGIVCRVPLMIRGPRVTRGVYDVEYYHEDFTPTVLDALGIPYDPASFEGVSGFSPKRPPPRPAVISDHFRTYRYDPAADVVRAIPR